eukprot:CAMPEP_0198332248 /NCGR_PEP_ID=MMETSP1450-20131203/18148_1 /TAXON_ID=753684 ORGANISM="Madagascaria erythrocladiodes, Strain CCMP3234" /NCGR_SAMPLE_ID=MMETSP1450 /ASSEMBLY_ACC=CAM_ASM_001115 /LENGTH=75 /DNA_ID=CAMNT_0044036689 /DNA_START=6 /DNA_END=230 /DNA_ORIENTATION=-
MIGTPYFLAPEMIASDAGYDTKVDIWALGITTLYMAHGKPPLHDVDTIKALWMIANLQPPQLEDASLWTPPFVAF